MLYKIHNNFIISKDNIYVAKVTMFEYYNSKFLERIILPKREKYRKVVLIDHHLIDFKTGNEIFKVKKEDGAIVGDVYENTMYCQRLYKIDNARIPNKDLRYAMYVYDQYLEKQKLIKSRKLIPFPKKSLTKK